MTGIRDQLLVAFAGEHEEHLSVIRRILARWEDGGGRPDADLPEIHRRAHSLKGAARAVDLRPVEAIAHHLEDLFWSVQKAERPLDADAIRSARRSLDDIEDAVGAALGPARPAAPSASRDDAGRDEGGRDEGGRDEGGGYEAAASTLRVDTVGLDRLLHAAAALQPEVDRQDAMTEALRRLRRDLADLDVRWRRLCHQTRPTVALRDVEAALRVVDHQAEAIHRLQAGASWSLRRLSHALGEDVRRLRFMPAETLYGGLHKMVRDLARSEGKEVDLDLAGLGVEADRAVLQALADPVIHLLRNAVTHGIEPAPERMAAGKRAGGRIRLSMTASGGVAGGKLEVRIADDGRGLDEAAIRRAAEARGLAPAADAAALRALILEPGFSTAREVTELAGRGMGLPIVREAVIRLQGDLDVASQPGRGTTITLSVPLTLTAQRLLLVSCRDETYALPAHGVAHLHRLDPAALFAVDGRPMARLGGEDIAITPLDRLLHRTTETTWSPGGPLPVAVLRHGDRRLGVAADAFLAVRDAPVTAPAWPWPGSSRLAGTIVLDDGTPAFVLRIAALFGHDGETTPSRIAIAEAAGPDPPTILVVDDSLTTRTLEKSILETHGYHVSLAVDGRQALDTLRARRIDLVVSDIEMPNMDGFALLESVRRDPALAAVPVILVTSRETPDDRARGLRLGADAYVVKRRFDQKDLMDTIRQLL